MQKAVNIYDLQAAAEKRAHAMVYGYLAGGADAERSLRRSESAFNDIELRHAVLHGVGHGEVKPKTKVLGVESAQPFFITSCAGQRMFHADGEVATAKAAKKHGLAMALSQLTTSTFEEVRDAHPDGAKILQLYVWRDRVLLKEVLDRAKAVGFTALALTADFSWVGNRERETRTGFTVPPSYSVRQCIDALKSPAWTFDYMSRVPYGYKAVPDADFPAESLVDFIASQMKVRSQALYWRMSLKGCMKTNMRYLNIRSPSSTGRMPNGYAPSGATWVRWHLRVLPVPRMLYARWTRASNLSGCRTMVDGSWKTQWPRSMCFPRSIALNPSYASALSELSSSALYACSDALPHWNRCALRLDPMSR